MENLILTVLELLAFASIVYFLIEFTVFDKKETPPKDKGKIVASELKLIPEELIVSEIFTGESLPIELTETLDINLGDSEHLEEARPHFPNAVSGEQNEQPSNVENHADLEIFSIDKEDKSQLEIVPVDQDNLSTLERVVINPEIVAMDPVSQEEQTTSNLAIAPIDRDNPLNVDSISANQDHQPTSEGISVDQDTQTNLDTVTDSEVVNLEINSQDQDDRREPEIVLLEPNTQPDSETEKIRISPEEQCNIDLESDDIPEKIRCPETGKICRELELWGDCSYWDECCH